MPHETPIFMLVMAGLAVVGVVLTIIYYFFRFAFKTDFDRDLERVKREQLAQTASPESASPELSPAPELAPPKRIELDRALAPTKASLLGRIKTIFSSHEGLRPEDREAIEEVLYTSDLGPGTVQRLLERINEKLDASARADLEIVRGALRSEMLDIFSGVERSQSLNSVEEIFPEPGSPLQVWMIVGVNGAGKTTSIGKLAHLASKKGLKVLVAAGDTFRAAAGSQLKAWTDRAQVEIFHPEGVTDPSAVAFAACERGKAIGAQLVIIDTAGRLHTQAHLMEELKKMKRVIQKLVAEGPKEVLLVLDANSGQNALHQAKQFNESLELTGVILTKLDGSAKGGVAVGLANDFRLPIRLIGVGEGIEDLRPFKAQEFVDSII